MVRFGCVSIPGFKSPVPVLATTNRLEAIDPAFARRLGKKLYVGLPDEVSQKCLLYCTGHGIMYGYGLLFNCDTSTTQF